MADDSTLKISVLSHLCRDDLFFRTVISKIPPTFFDQPDMELIYKAMVRWSSKYGPVRPRVHELRRMLLAEMDDVGLIEQDDRNIVLAIFNEVVNYMDYTPHFIEDQIYDLIRRTELRAALEASADLLDAGRFDEIQQRISAANNSVKKILPPINYWEDIEDRSMGRVSRLGRRYPTCSTTLDFLWAGGMVRGQSGIIVAPTGSGKTLLLTNNALRAMQQGFNVLFVTLELSQDEIVDRIDSMLTGFPEGYMRKHPKEVIKQIEDRKKKLAEEGLLGSLRILQLPPRKATVDDLDAKIEEMSTMEGFTPDIVLIDYADRLSWEQSVSRNLPSYLALEHLMDSLQSLAGRRNIVVWTASQARRNTMDKSDVVTAEDIASGYAKTFIMYVVLGVSQYPEEKDGGFFRIYISKSRLGHVGTQVYLQMDKESLTLREFPDRESYVRAMMDSGCDVPKKLMKKAKISEVEAEYEAESEHVEELDVRYTGS